MAFFFKDKRLITPPPARLVILVHYNDMNDYPHVCLELENIFGTIDYETATFKINTPEKTELNLIDDYSHRMLKILSFEKPIGRDELVSIQTKTLKIEDNFNTNDTQKLIIRPGYVTDSVAIGSYIDEHFHRIYMYNGVFAQTWYKYEKMTFQPLNHTPLFMLQKSIITAFNDIRLILESE